MTKKEAIIVSELNSYMDKENYYIRSMEIEESLSDITKVVLEVVLVDTPKKSIDLWSLDIKMSSSFTIELNKWEEVFHDQDASDDAEDNQKMDNKPTVVNSDSNQSKNIKNDAEKAEEEANSSDSHQTSLKQNNSQKKQFKSTWSRSLRTVITGVKKEIRQIDGVFASVLTVTTHHKLYLLTYNKKYNISKLCTHGTVVLDLCFGVDIALVNTCIIMQMEIYDMFIQFGECDLHLFERLVQYNGAFYICHDDGYTVGVHDTTLEYSSGGKYRFGGSTNISNVIYNLSMEQTQVPEQYVAIDYDYKKPENLYGLALNIDGTGKYMDYPARYADGLTEFNVALQPFNVKKKFVSKKYNVDSSCYDIKPGQTIIIEGWSNEDKHVIISVKHSFSFSRFNSNFHYYNSFVMHETSDSYVSPKELKAPVISSTQTATVRSLSPILEIETNVKCEVFVEFHWLFSLQAPNSKPSFAEQQAIDLIDAVLAYSCWVPVAQLMAGKRYGSFIIPRVGDEVLVYFIDGNPNRPIVFGAIYNDTNVPYYPQNILDDFKTVLMRSHTFYDTLPPTSILEPHTYNEISITDIPFAQKIYMKAQKDIEFELGMMTSIVPSDFKTSIHGIGSQKHFITAGNYELINLFGEETHFINGNCTFIVNPSLKGRNFTIEVTDGQLLINATAGSKQEYGANLLINVAGNCDINVEGDCNVDVEGDFNGDVEGDCNINVVGDCNADVEGDFNGDVAGDCNVDIEGAFNTNVAGDYNLSVEGEIAIVCAGAIDITSGADLSQEAGGAIEISAGGDISQEAGGAIEISAGGDISKEAGGAIESTAGAEITSEAGLDINMTAGGDISHEVGLEFNIEAGLAINMDSGLEFNATSGLCLSMESGLEADISSGLSADIEAGLELDLSSGLALTMDAGLMADMSAALMVMVDAGLMAGIDAGLMTEIASGLLTAVEAGLLTSVDGAVLASIVGGVLADFYGTVISGNSDFSIFCQI